MMMRRSTSEVRSEGGCALVMALVLVVVSLGIVTAGTITFMAHRQKVETNYERFAQASSLARSGLIEAAGWFTKQVNQPVTVFDPQLDPAFSPPILDTDDPDVGLVRDFQIAGQVWGRYEVWKEWSADPDPQRLAWRQQQQCTDISTLVGVGAGGSWNLKSTGYIYNRRDASKEFNELPNRVVASEVLEAEIRRLTLTLPGLGAINIDRGQNITVNTMGRVIGGSNAPGIYYPNGSGTPNTGPANTNPPRVTGNPALAPATGEYNDSLEAVFGLDRNGLLAICDDVITNMANFPVPVPTYSIYAVISNSIKFDASTPLNSSAAIVYMEGNVTLLQGNNSQFSGLLYVDGNITIREPSEIRGTIICTGTITIQGSGDYASVYFDEEVLNRLRRNIGTYEMSSPFKRTRVVE